MDVPAQEQLASSGVRKLELGARTEHGELVVERILGLSYEPLCPALPPQFATGC
jgi:hypothetical protein